MGWWRVLQAFMRPLPEPAPASDDRATSPAHRPSDRPADAFQPSADRRPAGAHPPTPSPIPAFRPGSPGHSATTPLRFTLTGSFTELFASATRQYVSGGEDRARVPVRIDFPGPATAAANVRMRGNTSLVATNFRKIRIAGRDQDLADTPFAGADSIRVITHDDVRWADDAPPPAEATHPQMRRAHDSATHREVLAYRLLEALGLPVRRAAFAAIRYVDESQDPSTPPRAMVRRAGLLEDADDWAARLTGNPHARHRGGWNLETALADGRYRPEALAQLDLGMVLVGNWDYEVRNGDSAPWNVHVATLRDGHILLAPYDFDYASLVNGYAGPTRRISTQNFWPDDQLESAFPDPRGRALVRQMIERLLVLRSKAPGTKEWQDVLHAQCRAVLSPEATTKLDRALQVAAVDQAEGEGLAESHAWAALHLDAFRYAVEACLHTPTTDRRTELCDAPGGAPIPVPGGKGHQSLPAGAPYRVVESAEVDGRLWHGVRLLFDVWDGALDDQTVWIPADAGGAPLARPPTSAR